MIEKRASAPPCNDNRECFAQTEYRGQKRCRILSETYESGVMCPFCKKHATEKTAP